MNTQRVELPIQYEDIACVTECWTFDRLAIIKTTPFYEDWIASHYRLYAEDFNNFLFGETFINPPGYHDAILRRRHIPFYNISEEVIVELLKTELSMRHYVIMQVKLVMDREDYHEVIFYGFDDTISSFLAVGNVGNFFKPIQYPYSYIENVLPEVKEHYLKNPDIALDLTFMYQSLMTIFEVDMTFDVGNCPFEAYRKVELEWWGSYHTMQRPSSFGSYELASTIYQGIDCLYAFQIMLNKEINGEEFNSYFRGLIMSAKKLQEHQKLVLHSMTYLSQKWSIAMKSQAADCIAEYRKCSQIVERWLNMIIKYEYTGQKKILVKIVVEIPRIFEREERCLDCFVHESIQRDILVQNFV